MPLPRNIRNNNPGNIRLTNDVWVGQIPREQASDKEFVCFYRPEWGIRALAKLLTRYYNGSEFLNPLRTVRGIINRWAPSVENNTSAYVSHVAG